MPYFGREMKVHPYEIRLIQLADLAAFRVLRRQALKEHPAAFAKFPLELDAMSDQALSSMVSKRHSLKYITSEHCLHDTDRSE